MKNHSPFNILKYFCSSSSKLMEMRELQELRKKPNGVSIVGLALGKKVTIEEEVIHVNIISRFSKFDSTQQFIF